MASPEKSSGEETDGTASVASGSGHGAPDSSDTEDNAVSMIRKFMAQKLRLYGDPVKDRRRILEDVSIDGVIKFINEGKCKNIITMAGAGISTSSGIPDFRSPGSGLYDNLEKYNLPDPQAIFEIDFFRENPQPFFTLAKELYPGSFHPTPCHYFLRLLHEKGLLLRHYTQNIDTLERVAGLPEQKLVEAHGTFHTAHCLSCRKAFEQEWVKEHIFADRVPTCTECKGLVKPDIVFFGESLPPRFFSCIKKDFSQCDLLIIMGSSLTVEPFASLVEQVPEDCPRLLINRTRAGRRNPLADLLGMGSGFNFDDDENTRDVLWLGDCDEGCRVLAEGLGWLEELEQLVNSEQKGTKTEATPKSSEETKSGKKDKPKSSEGTTPSKDKPKSPKS